MDDNLIEETVKRYIREYDRYKKLADIVFDICQIIVEKNLTVRATVQHRAKSPTSLTEKLRKSSKGAFLKYEMKIPQYQLFSQYK